VCFAGFSIEGPSKAEIQCTDNGDGSADVSYFPTMPGEYAVHILCDDEDIPKSPYIAQVLPKTDYHPEKVPSENFFCILKGCWIFYTHFLP
jgi:filamin